MKYLKLLSLIPYLKSQVGQDRWVASFYNYKKGGYFLDVGAYDGVYYSNTYLLEKKLGWDGLLIEADPIIYEKLVYNRNTTAECIAVSDRNEKVNFIPNDVSGAIKNDGIGYKLKADTLKNILKKHKVPREIDYLSLDIEGAEVKALEGMDFHKYQVGLITVEHNLYLGNSKMKHQIFKLLAECNFKRVKENISHKGFPFEDWYVNRELI